MDWSIIKENNKEYFSENPVSEIIIAGLFEQKYLKRNKSYLEELARFIYIVARGMFNNVRRSVKPIKKYDGVVIAHLDRANDWGIMYPLVKIFDDRGYEILFGVSEICYNNHKKELESLINTNIIVNKSLYSYRNTKLKIKHFNRIKTNFKKDMKIIKKYKLANSLQYVKLYVKMLMQADVIREKYLSKSTFSITLGERIWGIIYSIFGNKHYVMQHGHMTSDSIRTWPNYTSANNYRSIVFGSYYKTEFEKVYNQTKFIDLGNPYYDKFSSVYRSNKEKIVFFSSSHPFVGEKKIYKNKESFVYDTIDELVKLYNKYKNQYEFIVKLHPNELSDVFINSNKLFGKQIKVLSGNIDSFAVLREAKIAISWGSTVNLEAVLAGALSIQLLKDSDVFNEQEYSLVIKSLEEIEGILKNGNILEKYKTYQKSIIHKYISNLGKSSKNIVDYIESEEFHCKKQ